MYIHVCRVSCVAMSVPTCTAKSSCYIICIFMFAELAVLLCLYLLVLLSLVVTYVYSCLHG